MIHRNECELEAIQKSLYHRAFEQLAPSIFRIVEDLLAGHVNLWNHPAPRVRAKAERYGLAAHRTQGMFPASMNYLGKGAITDWLGGLRKSLAVETGPMTLRERLLARVFPAVLWFTDFKIKHGLDQQPEFSRRDYRMNGSA